MRHLELPMPTLDALPLGAHRAIGPTMLGDEALYQASGVRIAFTGRSGGVSEATQSRRPGAQRVYKRGSAANP